MELNVYAIKDRALDAFMAPFYMHTHGQAIRAFGDTINDPENTASKHPEDYDLYHLGRFNDKNGQFENNGEGQIGIGKNLFRKLTGPDNQGRN